MPLTHLDYAVGGSTALALALLYLWNRKLRGSSTLPLPPGPPSHPIIGSLLSLPPSHEPNWIWFMKWSKKTGSEVIHFNVLGNDTIVLNSRQAAAELLEHRSGSYSDRPHMVMASDLVGWSQMVGMADYVTLARDMRKLMATGMGPKFTQDWWPQQEQEALRFLQKLLRTPDDFIAHIRHASGATVARLTYGYIPKDENDEYIGIAERAMESFSQASTPGAFMVDVIPILRYIPWMSFQKTAAEWRQNLRDLVDVPMAFVKDQLNRGVAESSFVSKWLEDAGPKDDKSLIPPTAAALYAGGADTTVSAISTFFVAMLHYPEAQRVAQEEIDQVLGKDRLPTMADRPSLPYVEALYKEVLRWQPLAPIGIPHRYSATHDDTYNGMRIPANSMVIANIWAMLRDPEVYQNPAVFDPTRFLGDHPESNSEDTVFGFGRRRCPGVTVAQSSVWLSIALTLAAYDLQPLTGDDGKPVLPSLDYLGSVVRHPQPFRCRIMPRSAKMRAVIEGLAF